MIDEGDLIRRIVDSNEELWRMNEDFIRSPQTRTDRNRLLADHKVWQTARDELVVLVRKYRKGEVSRKA